MQNPKLSSVYRQNIRLLPYTLHLPTVKSTDRSKETRKNNLSLTCHKIYKRKHLYTPQLPPSINWLVVQIRSPLHISGRWRYVVNATPLPLYRRESDPVSIVRESGWTPGSIWMSNENLAHTGIPFPDRRAHSESHTNYGLPARTVVHKSLYFWGIHLTTITCGVMHV